jgi:hypothetical protein
MGWAEHAAHTAQIYASTNVVKSLEGMIIFE